MNSAYKRILLVHNAYRVALWCGALLIITTLLWTACATAFQVNDYRAYCKIGRVQYTPPNRVEGQFHCTYVSPTPMPANIATSVATPTPIPMVTPTSTATPAHSLPSLGVSRNTAHPPTPTATPCNAIPANHVHNPPTYDGSTQYDGHSHLGRSGTHAHLRSGATCDTRAIDWY